MAFPRNRDAEERRRERQRREDDAPRLAEQIPRLRALRMEISYFRGGTKSVESTHARVVVVERAPALFVIPCADRSCRDGGHDVTHAVLHALRAGQERFTGNDACRGSLGAAASPCTSSVSFDAVATYDR